MLQLPRLAIPLVVVTATAVAGCKKNNVTSNSSSSNVIGPSGGTASGPDGVELRVPGGALQGDTTFTLSVAQPDEYPAAGKYSFSGDVFAIEPHGQSFLTPATVVIPFLANPTDGVLLQAEVGDTAWTELPVIGKDKNAFEAAVSKLSYFVVADKAGGSDAGPPSCSGRSPVSGAPTGTVTNPSGATSSTPYTPFDSSTLKDGYAQPDSYGASTFHVTLTDYANACGYEQNDDIKIGGTTLVLTLPTSSPAVQNYPSSGVQVGIGQSDPNAAPGACGGNAASGSVANPAGTGVDITAVDATHIAGSYDVPGASGGTDFTGSFDVPICNVAAGITVSCCLQ